MFEPCEKVCDTSIFKINIYNFIRHIDSHRNKNKNKLYKLSKSLTTFAKVHNLY